MNETYKFTASEYAKMLGITTSALRKRRLKGQLQDQFIEQNGKYFYKTPERDRPNIVPGTPHDNPKFHGSMFRPKKYKSQYKKRRRYIPATEDTNYHNARNGWQLQQLNNLRQMARIREELTKDQLLEITPEIFEIARERHTQKQRMQAQKRLHDARLATDAGRQEEKWRREKIYAVRADEQFKREVKGRWYNHNTGQYEDDEDRNPNPFKNRTLY